MKMTDAESATDLCRRFDALVNAPGGGSQEDWSEWQCDAAAELKYLSARLAADQQKGGGEAVAVVIPNAVGVEVAWANPPSAGRPPVGTKLYTTPQPSIPAPAQQEVISPSVGEWPAEMTVEKAMAAQRYIRDWTPDYVKDYIDSISPAQQDGKASGGDWCPSCKGSGEVEGYVQPPMQSPEDAYIATIGCQECNGTGAALAHPPHADQETQG